MNLLIFTCLLCFVVFRVLGSRGAEASSLGELSRASGGSSSGEGLYGSTVDEEEPELEEGLEENVNLFSLHQSKDDKKRRRGKGKKKSKHKGKSTTAFNPEHAFSTAVNASALGTTQDPCASTHLTYCIHGYCKQIEGLLEPVCICMKGYYGERCGIQTLGTKKEREHGADAELVQTVLVVIAVVLSVISCTAILLMACAHYKTHKNFLASYLGTWAEQEKLQKPAGDLVV